MKLKVENNTFFSKYVGDFCFRYHVKNIEDIERIMDLFKWNNLIVVFDCDIKNNNVLEYINNNNIKYTNTYDLKKNSFVTVISQIPLDKMKVFLSEVIKSDIDSIDFKNYKTVFSWEQILYNDLSVKKMIKNDIVTVQVQFLLYENEVVIRFNSNLYDANKLISNIK